MDKQRASRIYIIIDLKPEQGCKEIQNAADGCSGIMMRLKIVKSLQDELDFLPQGNKVVHTFCYSVSIGI